MSKKRKPNSGDPRKDQVTAAARDAVRQTQTGGPQRDWLDLSRARELGPDEDRPAADELWARFRQAFTTTRIDACEHVKQAWGSRSAVPIHWALWRPDRAACEECFQGWLVPDMTGHSTNQFCDLCGAERPTDYMQLNRGPIVVHADICDECKAHPPHSDG